MKSKAVGERGSWFATVDGERLPCVHQYWIGKEGHRALRVHRKVPQNEQLVAAIQSGLKVIVTKDKVTGHGEAFERTGYVAVFAVDEVKWEDDVLSFRLTKRLKDLS